jgi:DNA-binding Xre family transcriptional regulator
MKEKGMKYTDLAKTSGIPLSSLYAIVMKGTKKYISWKNFRKLATALDLQPTDLFVKYNPVPGVVDHSTHLCFAEDIFTGEMKGIFFHEEKKHMKVNCIKAPPAKGYNRLHSCPGIYVKKLKEEFFKQHGDRYNFVTDPFLYSRGRAAKYDISPFFEKGGFDVP